MFDRLKKLFNCTSDNQPAVSKPARGASITLFAVPLKGYADQPGMQEIHMQALMQEMGVHSSDDRSDDAGVNQDSDSGCFCLGKKRK